MVLCDNELINECWLLDCDCYSYQGLYVVDCVGVLEVKCNGQWQVIIWEDVLVFVVEVLKQLLGSEFGVLVYLVSISEEGDLFVCLVCGLGSVYVDYCLCQFDFVDGVVVVMFGMLVVEVFKVCVVLLVGFNLCYEMLLFNYCLYQVVKKGVKVYMVNLVVFDFNYKLVGEVVVVLYVLVDVLLLLVYVVVVVGFIVLVVFVEVIGVVFLDQGDVDVFVVFKGGNVVIVLGELVVMYLQVLWLCVIVCFLVEVIGVVFNELLVGVNVLGLVCVGVLLGNGGFDVQVMLVKLCKGYVLYGVELLYDFVDGEVVFKVLLVVDIVVVFVVYVSFVLCDVVDVILLIVLLLELEGIMVNVDGVVQQ